MRAIHTATLAAMLAVAACSDTSEPASETEAAPQASAAPDEALTITPEYLAGKWCYVQFGAGDDISEENITYDFAADGSLKYQTNSSTPVDKDGSYTFEDGLLTVKPALTFIKLKPVTLDQDKMVLSAMGGQAIWTRGACTA